MFLVMKADGIMKIWSEVYFHVERVGCYIYLPIKISHKWSDASRPTDSWRVESWQLPCINKMALSSIMVVIFSHEVAESMTFILS